MPSFGMIMRLSDLVGAGSALTVMGFWTMSGAIEGANVSESMYTPPASNSTATIGTSRVKRRRFGCSLNTNISISQVYHRHFVVAVCYQSLLPLSLPMRAMAYWRVKYTIEQAAENTPIIQTASTGSSVTFLMNTSSSSGTTIIQSFKTRIILYDKRWRSFLLIFRLRVMAGITAFAVDLLSVLACEPMDFGKRIMATIVSASIKTVAITATTVISGVNAGSSSTGCGACDWLFAGRKKLGFSVMRGYDSKSNDHTH